MNKKFKEQKDINNLINTTLNVKTISEELVSFDVNSNPADVKKYLDDNRFDLVGVKSNDRIIGYTDVEILKETEDKLRYIEFHSDQIISSNTSLTDTMNLISKKDFLFILDGTLIRRIVTKADIYKDPVRLFIYNLISNFEFLLSVLIEHHFPQDEWKSKLTTNRLNKVDNIYQDRLRENTEFNMFDCLSIEDKIKLFLNKDKNLCKIFKISNQKQKDYFENLKIIRNSIAHVGKNPAVTNIDKILDTVTKTAYFSKLLEDQINDQEIKVEFT